MPKQPLRHLQIKRIFIGSPGDVAKEREVFRDVVEEVNKIKAKAMGIFLEPMGWEDTLPGVGRAQELINKDVVASDLIILVLWKRWGTPTGKYSSGFEEEYELALANNREMFLYIKHVPEAMMADPGDQLKKVIEFRSKVEKTILFKRYKDEEEFSKLLRQHLCNWLDGIEPDHFDIQGLIQTKEESERLKAELDKEKESHLNDQRQNANELAEAAQVFADSGHITKAEEYFAKASSTAPTPFVLNAHGFFLSRIGELAKAEEKFNLLLQLADKNSDNEQKATAYGNLGIVYGIRGDLDKSEEMYQKSLAINTELGRKEGMASQYGNLGIVYRTRGDLDKAEEMHQKSLGISEELGRKEGIAIQYGNLGIVYRTRGDLDKAEEMHQKSLAINTELGRKEGMANQYGSLGIVYQTRGDKQTAKEYYNKALSLFTEIGAKGKINLSHSFIDNLEK